MDWQHMLSSLDSDGVVEFGMHQMDLKSNTPKWRRHKGGSQTRFKTLRNALFSHDKGARVACLGRSVYAKKVYAAGFNSVVPYVSTWLQGEQLAFLVRAAAAEPEVTLVPAAALNALRGDDHATLLTSLGQLFGVGAQEHGVRLLASGEVCLPR
ncbi:MAG: hypothetical protein PHX69_00865 [Simplicispira sp.]|uniref:hypothetical protein n=1 Tax=Simplicispira sp. TaxID=2015802 RepID=UPI0025908950|nr:hypothetical protein [Simplicispira sp.]MDD2690317.1 hypothetical protein [Simplicispira sp.]